MASWLVPKPKENKVESKCHPRAAARYKRRCAYHQNLRDETLLKLSKHGLTLLISFFCPSMVVVEKGGKHKCAYKDIRNVMTVAAGDFKKNVIRIGKN